MAVWLEAKIPENLRNIDGMLLGRDTIYRNCWRLAYERSNEFIRPYVPTEGPVRLTAENGEEITLLVEHEGTTLEPNLQGPHDRYEEVNPNDCYLVVSTDQELRKGTGTSVPVHISNTKGQDIIFQNPTLLRIDGSFKL